MRTKRYLMVQAAVLLALVACTSESDGGAGADVPAAGGDVDGVVANAVAPHDYDSAIDEVVVVHVLREQVDAYLAECVTRRGGVSSYEATPPPDRESITEEEALGDFPNLALLRERGRTLTVTEPPPGISRDDYATDDEYYTAIEMATADRVYTDDERELLDECTAEADFAEVSEPNDLYQGMRSAWFDDLREIDSAAEVDDLRDEFRDCVVAGGMSPAPELNEITFWAYVDGENMALPDVDAQRANSRDRGMLFADCAADIYEVKDRLRREAHDAFVEEHEDDIARLSDYLYGEGRLDADG
ncbi:MAG: hypothetical protein JXA83_10800 [Acidimicrobiales bacterium]|nr:hypothetical protein [Acidimicrobiales bacterium]